MAAPSEINDQARNYMISVRVGHGWYRSLVKMRGDKTKAAKPRKKRK